MGDLACVHHHLLRRSRLRAEHCQRTSPTMKVAPSCSSASRCSVEHAPKKRLVAVERGLAAESASTRVRAPPRRAAPRVGVRTERRRTARAHRRRTARPRRPTSGADDLRQAADAIGEHRHAAAQRFQRRDTEALALARSARTRRRAELLGKSARWPRKRTLSLYPSARARSAARGPVGSVADQHQPRRQLPPHARQHARSDRAARFTGRKFETWNSIGPRCSRRRTARTARRAARDRAPRRGAKCSVSTKLGITSIAVSAAMPSSCAPAPRRNADGTVIASDGGDGEARDRAVARRRRRRG